MQTVQTISFLYWLMMEQNIPGPFLIVVPLSTLSNWEKECRKWSPLMNVVACIFFIILFEPSFFIFYSVTYVPDMGNSQSRQLIRDFEFYTMVKGHRKIKFNALLTTYELILKDSMAFLLSPFSV
jgi:chromodomain-helicase-DNA-binding protein 1